MSNRIRVAMVLAGLCVVLGPAKVMPAPVVNKTILKAYFQTGDKPTEAQFGNLIDSMVHQVDDSTLVGMWRDATGGAGMLDIGETIGPNLTYGPAAGLSDAWLNDSGFLALSFLTGGGQTHYGYLQIDAGPDPASPYPMLVEYLVYEDQPDASLETAEVPEPATMALLALGGIAIFRKRRRRSCLP